MGENYTKICLVVSSSREEVIQAFGDDCPQFRVAKNESHAVAILRDEWIDCLILMPDSVAELERFDISRLTKQFPAIPVLAITNENDMALACRLGQLGVKHVIHKIEIAKIEEVLQQLLSARHLRGGKFGN